MSHRVAIAIIAGVAITAMAIGMRLAARPHDSQTTGANGRMVLVSHTMPSVSQPGQPLHARLMSAGEAFHQQMGVVLTDDQCQPDAAGISRCLNTIRLASGRTITVRHPHRMSNVRCLTPGERVTVRIAAS